ncbi:MAG TPA: hypothetical protein VF706_06330, partial [Solirubrobacteraceae bacterium]
MRSRAFLRLPILAALLAAALLAGCSSGSGDSHTLRDDGQIATFVKDVARGRRAQWTLDPGASAGARRAWTDATSVESIGVELRFG